MTRIFRILYFIVLIFSGSSVNAQVRKHEAVRLESLEDRRRVDIFVNDSLFTSYQYPEYIEKPFLFPVRSADGTVITRGYPVEPRKGERTDHPHHIGLWFNYGNVNGIDFWNNSSAIPPDKKDSYGHIVQNKIITVAGGKRGILEVSLSWEDNKGNVILTEDAWYFFYGDRETRTIDHISTLTAVNGPVTFGDSKEGLFAIRVDRAFEMPSDEPLIFTDDKGNPSTIAVKDNNGVAGNYYSSSGFRGDSVWGTRNDWVTLTAIKNGVPVTIAMFDNSQNTGYPAYAHARGYGLFALNNFGQNSYDPKKDKRTFTLEKGQSVKLCHRLYIKSGSPLTSDEANKIFKVFSKEYK